MGYPLAVAQALRDKALGTQTQEFLALANILQLLSPEQNISGMRVNFTVEKSIVVDQGRQINDETIAPVSGGDIQPISKELIIRNRAYILDKALEKIDTSGTLATKELAAALQALGLSANNRIVNGIKGAYDWDGLKLVADDFGKSAANTTAITSETTAVTFLEALETGMNANNGIPDTILVGQSGQKVLRKAKQFLQSAFTEVTLLPKDTTVGNAIFGVIVGGKTLPVIYAGKVGTGKATKNNEVIPLSAGVTDIYLVSTAPDRMTFALEFAETTSRQVDNGIKVILEQYQQLCVKSEHAVYKLAQTV